MPEIFISYSRQELTFTYSLYQALSARGLSIWMDLFQLQPGADWQDGILEGLVDAKTVFFVVSKESVASVQCRKELETAQELGLRIILLIFEATPLAFKFDSNQPKVDWQALQACEWVDFRKDFNKAIEQLVGVSNAAPSLPRRRAPQSGNKLLPAPRRLVLLHYVALWIIVTGMALFFFTWLLPGSFDKVVYDDPTISLETLRFNHDSLLLSAIGTLGTITGLPWLLAISSVFFRAPRTCLGWGVTAILVIPMIVTGFIVLLLPYIMVRIYFRVSKRVRDRTYHHWGTVVRLSFFYQTAVLVMVGLMLTVPVRYENLVEDFANPDAGEAMLNDLATIPIR